MDLVSFTYDCYGKEITVKNPKYHAPNGEFLTLEKEKQNSLYTHGNILDSYLVLGKNGVGKTTFLNKLCNYDALEENRIKFSNNNYDKLVFCKISKKTKNYPLQVVNKFVYKYKTDKVKTGDGGMFLKFVYDNYKSSQNRIFNFNNKKLFLDYTYMDTYFAETHSKEILGMKNIGKSDKMLLITFYAMLDNNYEFAFLGNIYEDKVIQFINELDEKYQNLIIKINDKDCKMDLLASFLKEQLELFLNKFESYSHEEKFLYLKYIDIIVEFFCDCEFLKLNDNGLIYLYVDDLNDVNISKIDKLLNESNIFLLKMDGSSGEQSLIEIISCINSFILNLNGEFNRPRICYLLLDEIEQNLHPEWCRLLYTKIVEVIESIVTPHRFYIYISTHSPYIISDFTSDHIINLDEEGHYNEFQTFGANIHDILSKGMFLDNPMGEYAYSMIRRVHKALCTGLSKEEILEASGMDSEEKLRYFIDSIGEPLIKMQLSSLYEKVFEIEKNKIKISESKLKDSMTKQEIIELLSDYNIKID